ncbi:MAG TPA: DUF523 domain-containing protein [Firmicutes bacterium]|nr:DUF523 domain-containing protein [Candidatus Fermentithermobacillaceae bacterium]
MVSSCLCGFRCRYDGTCSSTPIIDRLMKEGKVVPVCPEILGGLPVPRPPSEILGGDGSDVISGKARVLTISGIDVTSFYVRGALRALAVGLESGCTSAVLKARSPACGLGQIYDGSFSRRLKTGHGVLASLLKKHGFVIYTENDLDRLRDDTGTP